MIFLLQSCSGGRIGNYLELSFKNIEQEVSTIDENDSNNEMVQKKKKNSKDSNELIITKTNKDFSKTYNDKVNIQKKQNLKSREINKRQNKTTNNDIIQDKRKISSSNFEPHSYRVIIILKEVDPKGPSQKFSNVLRNANINFEIEKIERFQENDFKSKVKDIP